MNTIVRHDYPVANLPDDLREGLPADAKVRIVIEDVTDRMPMTGAEFLESIRKFKATRTEPFNADEAVARIRALRDEWDD